MIKSLVRIAIVGGAVAGAVHLIRKHDLVTKAGVLANTAVEKAAAGAEAFVAKGIGLTDEALRRFAEDPTEEQATSEEPKAGYGDVSDDAWKAATRANGS